MRLLVLVFVGFFLAFNINAQLITINGLIKDSATDQVLIGASIQYGSKGALSDYEGRFVLNIEKEDSVIVSYVGYTSRSFSTTSLYDQMEILLTESQNILEIATITGSKFERKLSDAVVSIDVIKADFVSATNTNSMDELLQKVTGVQVLDGQANIRGGSGFSFGAGSRVMLLLNDIPFIQPDAGFTNWTDIPIENVHQIEVLKGSASALYGSAALNGIVNFRTKYAVSKPQTKLTTSYTSFRNPKDIDKKWWEDSPYEYSASILHRQKINPNLDLVFSGFLYRIDSYNEETYQRRYRFSTGLKYRLSDRLSISLFGLYNSAENSSFFLWKDGGKDALRASAGSVSIREIVRYVVDPTIDYYDAHNNKHKLSMRYFSLNNKNNLGQGNTSKNYYAEYQFQRVLQSLNTVFTAGLVEQYLSSDSELFSNAKFNAVNYAAYIQAEINPMDRVTLSLGGRYEYNELNIPSALSGDSLSLDDLRDGELIGKAGLNYSLTEHTFIRSSIGQGYRFPTVVERFIKTAFSSFNVFPNPKLLPEYGWSAEIGIKQGFRFLGFEGYLDLAFFNQRYQNMMEFTFVNFDGQQGFQSQNVGDTQTKGVELGIMSQAKLGVVDVRIYGGYTYIDPIYRDFESNQQIRESLSTIKDEITQNVLKYRSKHTFKFDVDANYKELVVGLNVQHASHVINVDNLLTLAGRIAEYRTANNSGYFVYSPRISYKFKSSKLSVLFNNILNEEYTLRPGLMEAPRNISVRLEHNFQ